MGFAKYNIWLSAFRRRAFFRPLPIVLPSLEKSLSTIPSLNDSLSTSSQFFVAGVKEPNHHRRSNRGCSEAANRTDPAAYAGRRIQPVRPGRRAAAAVENIWIYSWWRRQSGREWKDHTQNAGENRST